MPHTPQQVLATLKQQQYAPVYFLHGSEPYYIDCIVDYIEHHVLDTAEQDFNRSILYGKDHTLAQILTQARRFPMMAPRQVVIVKEAQEIQDLKKETGQKLLAHYLKAPQPTTLLVFAHQHTSLDGRKMISKLLDKHAIVVHSKPCYESQIPGWIMHYVKERGRKITERAGFLLSVLVGNSLKKLANELEKVMLNVKKGESIDEETIQKYIGMSREYNIFELQKVLITREVANVHQMMQRFEGNFNKHLIIPTIAFLFTLFNKILLVHHAKNKSREHLSKVLQVPVYFIEDYLRAAQNYSIPKVIANLHYLHQADLQSKGIASPSVSAGLLLKELIFKLMHED